MKAFFDMSEIAAATYTETEWTSPSTYISSAITVYLKQGAVIKLYSDEYEYDKFMELHNALGGDAEAE